MLFLCVVSGSIHIHNEKLVSGGERLYVCMYSIVQVKEISEALKNVNGSNETGLRCNFVLGRIKLQNLKIVSLWSWRFRWYANVVFFI